MARAGTTELKTTDTGENNTTTTTNTSDSEWKQSEMCTNYAKGHNTGAQGRDSMGRTKPTTEHNRDATARKRNIDDGREGANTNGTTDAQESTRKHGGTAQNANGGGTAAARGQRQHMKPNKLSYLSDPIGI